jgi:hypothetical protein
MEADIACSADMTGGIHHHRHLADFQFLGRNQAFKREGYHLLFRLAASQINTLIPPFTIEGM